MPYKSDAQRKFFHSAGAKKAGITKAEVKEFDSASKGMSLPEKAKPHMSEGRRVMANSLSDAIRKKKEQDERRAMWRGGLADNERDIMPVQIVGEDGIEQARRQDLNTHDDELIAEAKKKEEYAPDMSDSSESKILDHTVNSYAEGGKVDPRHIREEHHEPEHFSELNEKERFQMAMKHLGKPEGSPTIDSPKSAKAGEMESASQEMHQSEESPADPRKKEAQMLADGGKVDPRSIREEKHAPEHFSELNEKERFQMAMKHLSGKDGLPMADEAEQEKSFEMEPKALEKEQSIPDSSDPRKKEAQMLANGGHVSPKEKFSELNEHKSEEPAQKLEHLISEEHESIPKVGMKVDQVDHSHIMPEHRHMYASGGKMMPKMPSKMMQDKKFASLSDALKSRK
jgi:hypothetical protein